MVVDREFKKRQAEVLKNRCFPINDTADAYFASRFPGIADSTFFLYEIRSKVAPAKFIEKVVLGSNSNCLHVLENTRFSVVNPYSQKENGAENVVHKYYQMNIGLVEWHDQDKNKHYVLENIVDRKEGLALIGRSN